MNKKKFKQIPPPKKLINKVGHSGIVLHARIKQVIFQFVLSSRIISSMSQSKDYLIRFSKYTQKYHILTLYTKKKKRVIVEHTLRENQNFSLFPKPLMPIGKMPTFCIYICMIVSLYYLRRNNIERIKLITCKINFSCKKVTN